MARFAFFFLAIFFVGATMFAGLIFDDLVLDVTEDQHHSLAPGSDEVMANLGLSLQAELFGSTGHEGGAAFLSARAEQVKKQLAQLAVMSGGRFTWSHRKVAPHSMGEDQLIALGLEPIILPDGRRHYLGMVLSNSIDQHQVFPQLADVNNPNRRDLLMAIERLGQPEAAPIQLLVGKAAEPLVPAIRQAMQGRVTLRGLDEDMNGLDPEIPLLMLQPDSISGAGLALLSSALAKKMPLIVMVDPSLPGDAILPPPLLAQGLALEDGVVVDDRLAMKVRGQDATQPINYPLWLELGQDQFVSASSLQAAGPLRLTAAGSLVIGRGAKKDELKPLVWTSDQAGILPRSAIAAMPGDVPRTGWSNPGQKILALQVNRQDLHALVIADLDFLSPSWGFNDNTQIFMRLLLDHAGISRAASLDPGLPKDRPFTRLEDMRAEARKAQANVFARINENIKNQLANLVLLQNQPPVVSRNEAMGQVEQQLRDAERDLLAVSRQTDQGVNRMTQMLALANSFLVPLILAVLGGVLGVARMRRRRLT